MCGMAQMYSWLKTLYGDSDDFNWSQFGLPQDKVTSLERTGAGRISKIFLEWNTPWWSDKEDAT